MYILINNPLQMQSSQYLDNLCTLDAKFCYQDVLNFEGQNPFRFENVCWGLICVSSSDDFLCRDRSDFPKSVRRSHLRPCDTGGNSSEASTASSPHVALAGVERVRGGDKASTLVAPVARGHASCKGTEHEEQGYPQNSQQEKKENDGLWTLLII